MGTASGVVVVTGGTAGVGRATVRAFADAGWDVAVLARGRAGLDGAVADVEATGQRALGIVVDVSDADAVDSAADRVEAELGPIDVWVNNAFVGALAAFWDTSPEEFRRMTDVTYYGQVHGTRAALRLMRPRDRGAIVNVSSSLAYRGIPLQAAYCGAKHAVKGFTESVLTELRAEGSHVTIGMVTLPGVNTPQFDWNESRYEEHPMPVAPLVQPEVVARAILDAARHPRRNSWVGIASVYTAFGAQVLPAFMDWYLGRKGVSSQLSEDDAPRHGSNLFEPRDEVADRGARGSFSDGAAMRDPISALSRVFHLATRPAVLGLAVAESAVDHAVGAVRGAREKAA